MTRLAPVCAGRRIPAGPCHTCWPLLHQLEGGCRGEGGEEHARHPAAERPVSRGGGVPVGLLALPRPHLHSWRRQTRWPRAAHRVCQHRRPHRARRPPPCADRQRQPPLGLCAAGVLGVQSGRSAAAAASDRVRDQDFVPAPPAAPFPPHAQPAGSSTPHLPGLFPARSRSLSLFTRSSPVPPPASRRGS